MEKSPYTIHPILQQEFQDKCKVLKVKNPNHLIAAMMREFILECDCTDNNPAILVDSMLIEKKEIVA